MRERRGSQGTQPWVATESPSALVAGSPPHEVFSFADRWALGPPWRGLRWSLVYIAFLWYMAVITTYHLPFADIAMAVALLGLVTRREVLRFPPLLGWFGGFIVWAAVAYPTTPFPEQVAEQLMVMGKIWIVVLVAANALRTRGEIRFFIVFFLACFALFPLRGALVNYFVGYTVFGRAIWNFIYENPNELAALALLQLSMAAGLLVTERKKSWVWTAALIGVVLVPILVLMTQSRGGFIALSTFTLLVLVTGRKKLRALLALGTIGILVVTIAPGGVWSRVSGLTKATSTAGIQELDPEGSAKQRFQILRVAIKISGEHPMTGVGLGAYPFAHESYALDEEFDRTARGQRDTHNTMLTVLAETGTPGLLLFLALLLTTAFRAERVRRRCRQALPRASTQLLLLEFGFVAFLVAGVFGSLAQLSVFYIHLTLIWSVSEACQKELFEARERITPFPGTRAEPTLATAVPGALRPQNPASRADR